MQTTDQYIHPGLSECFQITAGHFHIDRYSAIRGTHDDLARSLEFCLYGVFSDSNVHLGRAMVPDSPVLMKMIGSLFAIMGSITVAIADTHETGEPVRWVEINFTQGDPHGEAPPVSPHQRSTQLIALLKDYGVLAPVRIALVAHTDAERLVFTTCRSGIDDGSYRVHHMWKGDESITAFEIEPLFIPNA